ncbi:hypothetical protein V8G54_007443 [Vigna mungo]|uniref:Uncharacterized protein n=1 Tax=Vigna mungo TaxID=3915 RepID=A0AAQ3P3D7_VIGMU
MVTILKDCTGEDVIVNKFFSAIFGNKSALWSVSGKVMDSGPNDQILILYSGHHRPGVLGDLVLPHSGIVTHWWFDFVGRRHPPPEKKRKRKKGVRKSEVESAEPFVFLYDSVSSHQIFALLKHASELLKSLFYELCNESGSIFEGLLPEGLIIYAKTSAKAEDSWVKERTMTGNSDYGSHACSMVPTLLIFEDHLQKQSTNVTKISSIPEIRYHTVEE